ncbi:MAG: DNA alkylation repair protein [Bryobacteraceae bacterium]
MASVQEILKRLKGRGSAENVAGMARFGITVRDAYGVPMGKVKELAREIGKDHTRAMELWKTGNREARLLAAFTANPKQLTRAEMDRWARDFDSWDICDGCAIHLFRKSPLAWEQALQWTQQRPEFIRRAGFAMIATLAVHDKKAPDETFLEVLPIIEAAATDERNFVKKAVNWALRQIGKRNPDLRKAAMEVASRLDNWVGKDALRELSASSNRQRSSRPSDTPSKRTAPGKPGRLKIPTRRRDPD